MKERRFDNQRGASLIVAIAFLLVMGIISAAFVSMVNTETFISMNQSGGQQTFFIAEGGVEFGQRLLAQNLDWYRSTIDPILVPATNLGAGAFSVSLNLPATMLRNTMTAAVATMTAYTTQRFPFACPTLPGGLCYLQIEDDVTATGEFVQYGGIVGNTFTGLLRGRTVGTVASAASAHDRGDRVYPVTTLLTPLTNNAACPVPNPFQITANSKFLTAGTISIYDNSVAAQQEEITYTGSTTAGNVMTLTGVARCQNGTGPFTLNAGSPVTPILVDAASPDFEAEITSTGTVGLPITGNAARVVRKTVQR